MNPRIRDGLVLAGVLALAILTRGYGFATGSFRSDEFFTVDQVVHGTYGLKPAYYYLTGLMFQVFGVSEWSARIVAVVLGVAGILAVFFLARSLANTTAGWMAALLTTLNGWHLFYSQFSRFYSGVFLFGALSYWAFYAALQRGSVPLLFLALLCSGIGVLFHTTAVMVPVSCALYSVGVLIWDRGGQTHYSRSVARLCVLVCVVLGAAATPYGLYVVRSREAMGEAWGYGTPLLALQLVKYIGPPLVVAAIGGLLLFGRRMPWKAAYVGLGLLCSILFLFGMTPFGSMRPDYTFFALPLWITCAAIFCTELLQLQGMGRIASGTALCVLLIGMTPEFVSEYTGRRSLDPRDAIRYVEKNFRSGDKILYLLNGNAYYWDSRHPLEQLPANPYHRENDWVKLLAPYGGPGVRLWVVVPLHRQPIVPSLRRWLAENTSLVWERQATRYDYTLDGIQIFLKR